MEIRRLPADEAAVRRYLERLWVPFNRELEGIAEGFALADDVDPVESELEYRLDRLEEDSYRAWVAVDADSGHSRARGRGREQEPLAEVDGEFAGFVATEVDEPPSTFDRPDRLVIRDIYVGEPYRGTGLARELIDRARTRARERGCSEFALEVDVENERALAFYEKLGFETVRRTMVADVDADVGDGAE
ncbi:N-acetyltransferase [Halobiforma lacisalsi AJ5]|uniref:Acetyltransferase n=1 Tax=Natronobacterium lacisalsi AJ5 TaxID=358396 RepID=M0L303_NATLA|nr:GNAT family N-acetyltransferase [Halobiforma lacisalsi]APW98349.1 N-acetyltransferase [Halobiforma lacisalsi AJ5]EMA27952.1 acetyltransferase [Halobiforma lacisalsi AJ5]